jgi:hypothetical protein
MCQSTPFYEFNYQDPVEDNEVFFNEKFFVDLVYPYSESAQSGVSEYVAFDRKLR